MSAKLLVVKGAAAGRSFVLDGESFTVGREAGSDLQLPEREVSRRHCVIERGGDGAYAVSDLGSRRGTFVNELPVRRQPLRSGDVLVIGGSELLFLVSDPVATAPPAGNESWVAASTMELSASEARFLRRGVGAAAGADAAEVARALETLFDLSRKLLEGTEAETVAADLLAALLEAVPADRGAVWLCEADGEPRLAAARTREGEGGAFAVSEQVVRQVGEGRRALLATDLRPDDAGSDPSGAPPAVHSLLCAPLVRGDQMLGLLYLDVAAPPGLDDGHLELATAAAACAALALDNARHVAWLRSESRRLAEDRTAHEMVGESAAMRKTRALLERVAAVDSTVLLRGESGTGKELAARAIHRASDRADGPFVAINCANLSETLLESELFGHEKGAFTGATERRPGKLEAAHGGTLFLDEVGEIPPALQARLLRALEQRSFTRVGGHRPVEVDVRLLAATNRDLEAAIRARAFREDLLYRLNVITVTLPPLRERHGDVALLARCFSARLGRRFGRTVIGPSPAALALLEAYSWPGNVRQLANVVERAVVLGEDELIHPEDLAEEILDGAPPAAGVTLGNYQSALTATKKALIREAFREADGDLAEAARRLGLHLNSLHRLIRNLGLRSELASVR